MADFYPHKSGLGLIEPIALVGHNVAVLWANLYRYYEVVYVEPIPPFQFLDLGAIAAQTRTAPANATNLDMKDNEFAQMRWYPLDNVQARMWQPGNMGRYTLRTIHVPVDMAIVQRDPCLHLTEFFTWEDERPQFDASNTMDYPLTQCRLVCFGFRFKGELLEEDVIKGIKEGKIPCTYIAAQGMN